MDIKELVCNAHDALALNDFFTVFEILDEILEELEKQKVE